MNDLVYAQIGVNSPNAGSIGWVDFDGISISPGNTINMEATAKDGSVISFTLDFTLVSGGGTAFTGAPAPSFSGASFGNQGYRFETERLVVLYNSKVTITGSLRFTFSNIKVRSRKGNVISTYRVVVADGETTNSNEKIQWTTSGSAWSMLINLPPSYGTSSTPQISGLNTNTVIENGRAGGVAYAPVMTTMNPSTITVDISTTGGKQGFAIGFVVTSVTLYKDIAKRIDPEDQFRMTITGTQTSEIVTTGSMDGIQSEFAQLHMTNGEVFTINETLANTRLDGLDDYRQNVTAVNLAEGGSSPATGSLPINSSVVWGDMMVYTIQNRPNTSDVWVEKSTPYQSRYAGESITYVVVIGNGGPDDAIEVQLEDAMHEDMIDWSYLSTDDNVWKPWNGSLYIGTLPVGVKKVYYLRGVIKPSCQLTQLDNTAFISTANYDPNLINNSTESVVDIKRSANITISKVPDQVEAARGSWLTYTLEFKNLGPSDMSNIILTDPAPENLEEVQYSIDNAASWLPWNGTYTIAQLNYNETMTILIKGRIKFKADTPAVSSD